MQLKKRICLAALAGLAGLGMSARADGLLFDFGADATTTGGGPAGPATTWNNITTVGMDDFGVLDGLLTTEGNASAISLLMVSRFNGANAKTARRRPAFIPPAPRAIRFTGTRRVSAGSKTSRRSSSSPAWIRPRRIS
jgi:hypothetical protein